MWLKDTYIRLVIFSLLVFAATVLYWPAIARVAAAVIGRQDSSHGLFVPFMSAYFIWINRQKIEDCTFRYEPIAIPVLALFVILSFSNIQSFQLGFLSVIGLIAGICFFVFGRQLFKIVAFPVFFFITMTPIPQSMHLQLAEFSRFVTYHISIAFVSIIGIPFHTEGWFIQLPNALLDVALSCGGIRYLITFFMLGIAYSYIFRNTLTGRIILVLSTIPISIMATVVRLTANILMAHYISPRLLDDTPHQLFSWLVFLSIFLTLAIYDQHRLRGEKFRLERNENRLNQMSPWKSRFG